MKSIIIAFTFLLLFILSPVYVLAEKIDSNTCPPGAVCLTDPLASGGTNHPGISELIGRGIKGLLSVIGSIALVLIIYGGFTWMTAAGSAEKVTKGRDIIVYVALGLIIIFSAYAILNFIFSALAGTSS